MILLISPNPSSSEIFLLPLEDEIAALSSFYGLNGSSIILPRKLTCNQRIARSISSLGHSSRCRNAFGSFEYSGGRHPSVHHLILDLTSRLLSFHFKVKFNAFSMLGVLDADWGG